MSVQWLLIATEAPPHTQRFARAWQPNQDFARIIQTLISRPSHAPILAAPGGRRIAVRAYSSLLFAIGIDEPEDETDAFELIHLLILVLDDYFGCVRESDIIRKPEVVVKAVELMICGGVVVDTNRASIVRRLKHWK